MKMISYQDYISAYPGVVNTCVNVLLFHRGFADHLDQHVHRDERLARLHQAFCRWL
jgi:hypothetical protein